MDERTCVVCDTPLAKKPGPGRWPKRCLTCRRQDRRASDAPRCKITECTSSAKARGMCAMHYQRWRKNDTPDRPRIEECLNCQAALNAGGDLRQKYCSVECRDISYHSRTKDARNAFRRVETAARLAAMTKECVQCGGEFTPAHSGGQKFCSRRCNAAHHRDDKDLKCSATDCAKPVRAKGLCVAHYNKQAREMGRAVNEPWGDARRDRLHRRRALKAGTACSEHPVLRDKIAKRDGYTCDLCGDTVDMTLKWPDDMSPSLDHTIPLSLGGPHCAENVKLAHLTCNVRKGARTA